MDGRDSIQSLLVLRKLTRAMADAVRAQMTEYLATLAPLLRPQMVLGDYVRGRIQGIDAQGRQGVQGTPVALRDGRRPPSRSTCRAS